MKSSDDPVGYYDIRNILTTVDLLTEKGSNKKGSNKKGFTFSPELLSLVKNENENENEENIDNYTPGKTDPFRKIATLFAQELQDSAIHYNPLCLDSTQPRDNNLLDNPNNVAGLLTSEQVKDLNSLVIQDPMEDPTGKHVPLYVLRPEIGPDSSKGKYTYTEKDGNPDYLGGVESIARTSAGVADFPRKAKQTFFADPQGNTTLAFRKAQLDHSQEGENDPIAHLKAGISQQYYGKASFENSTAILSTAQTFFSNSYTLGDLKFAQHFESYQRAGLREDQDIYGSPVVFPIYQAYENDQGQIKMKEYYLATATSCSLDNAGGMMEAMTEYNKKTEDKLNEVINSLLNTHYNAPKAFEEALIAELKNFPGASLLVVDNGVQKHAINYQGTEPDAATLVLGSVDCLSNWDTQTKCREVLKQLNTSNTPYTAETFLQALRLPTDSFEHKVMLRLNGETDPLKGFFMKLGVSLVAIGKSIFNWLLPKTPPRYPTLNLSGLRDLWSDKSNLSKIHSMLAPYEHPEVTLTNNPPYDKGPANNNTYEATEQFEGVVHPLHSILPLYTQVATMVFKDSKSPIKDEEIKASLYKLKGINLDELNSSLRIMMAKNENLYDIQATQFDNLEQFNSHIMQLQTTKPEPKNIFPLLPLLDSVKATFTQELKQEFEDAKNFTISKKGRTAEQMIESRLELLKGMSRPDNVAQIEFENRLMLLKHSTILTVGDSTWIRPSNQLETVIKNQLMFGQLCGGVTEESLAAYNRFSHALGQSYVQAQGVASNPQNSDKWDIRLRAHQNIKGKLTQMLASEANAKYVEPNKGANAIINMLKKEMTLDASTRGKSTSLEL